MIEINIRIISPLFFCFFLGACGGSGPSTLPDAPPPWQEVSSNGEKIAAPPPSPFGGTNPRLENSTAPNSFWSKQRGLPSTIAPDRPLTSRPNYTINAYANVWVLIQDKRGNELEWISMKSGDEVPIMHRGPLTVTCSSSKSVMIADKNGKKIETGNNSNGINIVRLP